MMIDANSGQIITAEQLLNGKSLAGSAGNIVNPTVGYVPIRKLGRKYPFDPDYTNFGPRLAAAWNPGFSGGWLGNLLGNKKSVIRGGWGRAFERKNGVGLVLTPALGIGFGDLSVCKAPTTTGGCAGASNPNTAFRIGTEGNKINITPLPVRNAVLGLKDPAQTPVVVGALQTERSPKPIPRDR